MSIAYDPPPTVARFMESAAAVRLIMGPLGSGKTTGCIMEVVRRAKQQAKGPDGFRRTRWAFVRNTAEQLRDTTLKSWLMWFPDGVAGRWRSTERTFYLEFDDVRAEILFRPLDDPDDVRRLLSLDLTGAYLNELREIDKEIMIALRSRCGRYPSKKDGGPTWYGVLGDTNPPSMDHWIYESFEVERPHGWVIFKQPGGRDPGAENRENLPETYYEDLMQGAAESWVKVHVDAQYGPSQLGKPVYEHSFIEGFHVAAEPLRAVPGGLLVIGMDFGRTPAAVIKQRDPRGRVLTLDEVLGDNVGLEMFLARQLRPFLAQKYPGYKLLVSGDPAGWAKSQINEVSCFDALKAAGFTAMRAPTNDVDKRIEATEKLLAQQVEGKAMYLVSPACKKLVAGFKGGYKYKLRRDGSAEPSPLKNEFSHPHDANQYADLVIEGAQYGSTMTQRRDVQAVSMRAYT